MLYAWNFYLHSGDQTHVLILTKQVFYWLGHSSSPNYNLLTLCLWERCYIKAGYSITSIVPAEAEEKGLWIWEQPRLHSKALSVSKQKLAMIYIQHAVYEYSGDCKLVTVRLIAWTNWVAKTLCEILCGWEASEDCQGSSFIDEKSCCLVAGNPHHLRMVCMWNQVMKVYVLIMSWMMVRAFNHNIWEVETSRSQISGPAWSAEWVLG